MVRHYLVFLVVCLNVAVRIEPVLSGDSVPSRMVDVPDSLLDETAFNSDNNLINRLSKMNKHGKEFPDDESKVVSGVDSIEPKAPKDGREDATVIGGQAFQKFTNCMIKKVVENEKKDNQSLLKVEKDLTSNSLDEYPKHVPLTDSDREESVTSRRKHLINSAKGKKGKRPNVEPEEKETSEESNDSEEKDIKRKFPVRDISEEREISGKENPKSETAEEKKISVREIPDERNSKISDEVIIPNNIKEQLRKEPGEISSSAENETNNGNVRQTDKGRNEKLRTEDITSQQSALVSKVQEKDGAFKWDFLLRDLEIVDTDLYDKQFWIVMANRFKTPLLQCLKQHAPSCEPNWSLLESSGQSIEDKDEQFVEVLDKVCGQSSAVLCKWSLMITMQFLLSARLFSSL